VLAARNSPWIARPRARLAFTASALASVLIIVAGIYQGGDIGRGVASVWAGALLLTVIILLVRQIMLLPEVTVQSIYGAISTYLIIGMMFSSFFAAMYWFGIPGEPFFAGANAGAHQLADFQYFSFTTLTTLGYGDFTAQFSDGRAVATLEAMAGQIFLATLVAKLVASFRPAAASGPPAGRTAGSDD
jgi:Ion channel